MRFRDHILFWRGDVGLIVVFGLSLSQPIWADSTKGSDCLKSPNRAPAHISAISNVLSQIKASLSGGAESETSYFSFRNHHINREPIPVELTEKARGLVTQIDTGSDGIRVTAIVAQERGKSEQSCEDQGKHLPSIRELALTFNPAAVSDLPKEGYAKVAPLNEAPFYYKTGLFKLRFPGDPNLGVTDPSAIRGVMDACLWSTSNHPSKVIAFNLNSGTIDYANGMANCSSDFMSAVCFDGPAQPQAAAEQSSSLESCDPDKVAQANSGYTCSTDGHIWKVESEGFFNKRRVFHDMNSGLTVTAPLDLPFGKKGSPWLDNPACGDGYRLPKAGGATSEFGVLLSDGILDVVPGMNEENRWFWTGSVDSQYPNERYIMIDGQLGGRVSDHGTSSGGNLLYLTKPDGSSMVLADGWGPPLGSVVCVKK